MDFYGFNDTFKKGNTSFEGQNSMELYMLLSNLEDLYLKLYLGYFKVCNDFPNNELKMPN